MTGDSRVVAVAGSPINTLLLVWVRAAVSEAIIHSEPRWEPWQPLLLAPLLSVQRPPRARAVREHSGQGQQQQQCQPGPLEWRVEHLKKR